MEKEEDVRKITRRNGRPKLLKGKNKKILLNTVLRRRKEFGIGSMVEKRRKLKERKKLN